MSCVIATVECPSAANPAVYQRRRYEVFNWWMENDIMPGQMEIDDDDDYEIID